MSRPAGSAFPPSMFTAATGVPPERGPGFEAGAWRKGNVIQKVPNAKKNPKKESRISVGNLATGAEPTAQKLALGGTRRKGGKRSKTRRLSKKRRITRRLRKGSHQRGEGCLLM